MAPKDLKAAFTTEVAFFYVTMGFQILSRSDVAFLYERARAAYGLFNETAAEHNLPSMPFEEFFAYLFAGIVQTRTIDAMLDSTVCGSDILERVIGPIHSVPLREDEEEDEEEEDGGALTGEKIVFEDNSN